MEKLRKALVFDYDGVLADTEPLHWKSWAALLQDYGFQLTWEEYCRFGLGVSDDRILQLAIKKAPHLSLDELSRQNLQRKRNVCEWSLAEIPIPKETVELLAKLKGYKVGLVTSSNRAEVEPILRARQIYEKFDAIVYGEDVSANKPAPDPYLLIAKMLGVSTGTAFEDSEPGLTSARAAGFKAVRVERPSKLAQLVARSLGEAAL